MPIYKIYFQDGTIYEGGPNVHDSKWMGISDKPILRLEYFIGAGEGIILEGFESYFCYVEAEAKVSSKIGDCPKCKCKGKISKKITKYTNNTASYELIARCTRCDWVGKVNELIYKAVPQGDKFIYIMGQKKGMVTSYRVALTGKNGEDKYQTGDITKRIIELGKEDNGRATNLKLWKKGN